ncbi:hypothetical protein P4H39_03900 [Paenibacillus lautus]|nr:hypothetical protein [Paenibacillus lautus]MEC0201768.1 hypothetical protein [Paenibacillus lautus]
MPLGRKRNKQTGRFLNIKRYGAYNNGIRPSRLLRAFQQFRDAFRQ